MLFEYKLPIDLYIRVKSQLNQ
jgi:CRP-like cAMP-binding protein